MANVYEVAHNQDEKNTDNFKIPSVAYLKYLLKAISDEIAPLIDIEVIDKINMDESTDISDFPIECKCSCIPAEKIFTDINRKFVSEAELSVFKDKPTKLELASTLLDFQNEIKNTMEKYFVNLLNTPNALQQLKDVSNLIKEDNNLSILLNVLSAKLDQEIFDEHAKSIFHITNNDRKALNILLTFIKNGGIDWENNSPESLSYIKNKPTSLPANGGNADTVKGYCITALLNHQMEDIIVGSKKELYPNTSVDTLLDELDNTIFKKYCNIGIKYGKYLIPKYDIVIQNCNIKGMGFSTIFINENTNKPVITISASIISDITFKNTKINIFSYTKLNNVRFEQCEICINESLESDIISCIFDGCDISYNGTCLHNIITQNRVIGRSSKNALFYYGGDNIIDNNLYY